LEGWKREIPQKKKKEDLAIGMSVAKGKGPKRECTGECGIKRKKWRHARRGGDRWIKEKGFPHEATKKK